MKIYVASSWRNERQPSVVKILRDHAHEVYDFRNPPGRAGFGWEEINENWQSWTNAQYLEALQSDLAHDGFFSDLHGMIDADACVMVMPCGRSAHLEAGWMKGTGKPTFILLSDTPAEPELMYRLADLVTDDLNKILEELTKAAHEMKMKAMRTAPF